MRPHQESTPANRSRDCDSAREACRITHPSSARHKQAGRSKYRVAGPKINLLVQPRVRPHTRKGLAGSPGFVPKQSRGFCSLYPNGYCLGDSPLLCVAGQRHPAARHFFLLPFEVRIGSPLCSFLTLLRALAIRVAFGHLASGGASLVLIGDMLGHTQPGSRPAIELAEAEMSTGRHGDQRVRLRPFACC
jgi:hypothetical protein